VHHGIIGLRKLLADPEIRRQAERELEEKNVKSIVRLASWAEYSQVVMEVSWCLANLTSSDMLSYGMAERTHLLEGAVFLLEQAKGPCFKVFENVTILMGNLAVDSTRSRDYLIGRGCIELLG
jgi:hypothetical protein